MTISSPTSLIYKEENFFHCSNICKVEILDIWKGLCNSSKIDMSFESFLWANCDWGIKKIFAFLFLNICTNPSLVVFIPRFKCKIDENHKKEKSYHWVKQPFEVHVLTDPCNYKYYVFFTVNMYQFVLSTTKFLFGNNLMVLNNLHIVNDIINHYTSLETWKYLNWLLVLIMWKMNELRSRQRTSQKYYHNEMKNILEYSYTRFPPALLQHVFAK